VRGGGTHVVLTFRFMQKIGRLGAQARIDNSTKEHARNGCAMRRSRVGAKSTHEAAAGTAARLLLFAPFLLLAVSND